MLGSNQGSYNLEFVLWTFLRQIGIFYEINHHRHLQQSYILKVLKRTSLKLTQ